MKFFIYLLLAFCSGFLYFIITPQNILLLDRNKDQDIFVSDSGYISSRQAANLFLKLSDTIKLDLNNFQDADTVGKYYKTHTGNYLSCIINVIDGFGDSHFLIESKPDGSIIQSEHYGGGNYSCCWENHHEGFKKQGDYYSVKTCTTGAGLCSEETYFFKTLIPLHKQSFIITNSWFSMYSDEKRATDLSSEIEIKSDTIIAHYTLKKIKMGKKKDKVKKTERFDVRYIQRESKWVALDSSRIADLPR